MDGDGSLMTVVCMREPNLPPSAVRVGMSGLPGLLVLSLSLSPLSSLAMSCCQCTYACLWWRGLGAGGVRGSCGGDIGTWAASVFFLSLSTLVF